MKDKFKVSKDRNTEEAQSEFNSMPIESKISFYIQYKNFEEAIKLINQMPTQILEHKILLAKLNYWLGKDGESKNIIENILSEEPDNFETFNRIGIFYLQDLFRVKEALPFLKKSLELNGKQPEIIYLIDSLTSGYMERIKEIWPD